MSPNVRWETCSEKMKQFILELRISYSLTKSLQVGNSDFRIG